MTAEEKDRAPHIDQSHQQIHHGLSSTLLPFQPVSPNMASAHWQPPAQCVSPLLSKGLPQSPATAAAVNPKKDGAQQDMATQHFEKLSEDLLEASLRGFWASRADLNIQLKPPEQTPHDRQECLHVAAQPSDYLQPELPQQQTDSPSRLDSPGML